MGRRVRLDSQTGIVSVVGDLPYWRIVETVKEKAITYEEPGGRTRDGRKLRLRVDGALSGFAEYPPAPFLLDIEQCYGGWEIADMWPISGKPGSTSVHQEASKSK